MQLNYEVPTMCVLGLTVLEIELELNSIIMSPHYMCIDKEYLGIRLRMKLNYEVPTMCVLGLTILAIELELN